MKELIKKTGVVFAIVMTLEIVFMIYIDKFYLKAELDFKSVKVNSVKVYKKDEVYTLLEGTTNVKLSDTKENLAYFKDNKLKVVNLKDKTEKEVILENIFISEKTVIKDYRWIKNSDNLLIIGIDEEKSVTINSYDIKNGATRGICPWINYGNNKLTLKDIKLESIIDVEENIANNSTYINGINKTNNKHIILWSTNIDWNVLREDSSQIGRIKALSASSDLLYEDLAKKTINKANEKSSEVLFEGRLLGVDAKSNIVYYDKTVEEKINEIKIKGLETKEDKTYNMDKGVLAQEITVLSDGNVFVNDKEEHKITSIINKETISYDGELLDIKEDYIVSNDNGKIMVTYIK